MYPTSAWILQDCVFKISSYKRLDREREFHDLLKEGNILVIHFRVSWNFFYLRPGEIYQYDEKTPIIHAKSGLPASHAVMMLGTGRGPNPDPQRHVLIQNSEGVLFGIGGVGKVSRDSVKGVYQIIIEDQQTT